MHASIVTSVLFTTDRCNMPYFMETPKQRYVMRWRKHNVGYCLVTASITLEQMQDYIRDIWSEDVTLLIVEPASKLQRLPLIQNGVACKRV